MIPPPRSSATDPIAGAGRASSGWWIGLLIFLTTLVVYGPALRGGFVWDDRPGHVTKPELQSLTGLGRIWIEVGATQQYYPVLHTAFWLEHRLWGDAPAGYHVLNVLLHAAAACLVGAVLRRLGVPGAGLAAWLFALHPVGVESVAWISEQKNTLSTVLYLSAALVYLRFEENRRRSAYALATLLFILALLTKTVTATLPAALLVVAWWRRGRLSWRADVQPLLPWFALGAAGGLLTAWIESTLIGAQGAEFTRSLLERSLLPGRVILFYLGKLVWPANLTFIYPRWIIAGFDPAAYLFTAVVLGGLGFLWVRRTRGRGPLAAALFFLGTLFPVLGFLNVYPFRYSFVADHFQYLACIGPLALVAAGMATGFAAVPRRAVGFAAAAALATMSWSQSAMYRDVFTLYSTTLARNPACWMAHNNLAEALTAAGRPADAIPHLEQALRLKPDSPEAENNLGDNLRRLGRPAEAIPHLEKAIALQPTFAEARNNLGVARLALGDHAAGKAEFEAALRLKPGFALARFNLGLACANEGNVAAAIRHFEQAVALDPDYAEAELNWAIGVLLTDGFRAAAPHFERALKLEPTSADAHYAYGRALARERRFDEAIAELQRALQLNPQHADAHLNLALALRERGRLDEAAAHYEQAARLRGGRPEGQKGAP